MLQRKEKLRRRSANLSLAKIPLSNHERKLKEANELLLKNIREL